MVDQIMASAQRRLLNNLTERFNELCDQLGFDDAKRGEYDTSTEDALRASNTALGQLVAWKEAYPSAGPMQFHAVDKAKVNLAKVKARANQENQENSEHRFNFAQLYDPRLTPDCNSDLYGGPEDGGKVLRVYAYQSPLDNQWRVNSAGFKI